MVSDIHQLLLARFRSLEVDFNALNRDDLEVEVKVIKGQESTLYSNFRVSKANDRVTSGQG